ncbi:MAG: hypothetical protein A4E55_02293 [Pelotomaculum sp. PtaU1.Bin035]|nr:MAG: hypothetical protein A4E55_02293 [Pelotomaculum sp. PtaU1.Bin035]
MFKNKHFNAIITKFLLVVTVLGIILPPVGNVMTFTAVIAALVVTLAAYLVADLIILPLYGNRVAVAADGVITIAVAWEIVWVMESISVPILGLVLVALLIGLGEWYYHNRYLARLIFKGKIKP